MKTTHLLFAAASALLLALSAAAQPKETFCNPLDIVIGQERAYRGGEPVVLIFEDDYFLFVSHRKGYWYSPDFKDWTYVDAPNYPGGVVSVVEMDGALYGCSMNNKRVFKAVDPRKGEWVQVGTLDSDRYGDANMFYDNGHLYLYYGWSQIMPFKVVELDKTTFKEIDGPKVLFFGDHRRHGFESRRNEDVIYSIFNGRRDYFEEEYPWIEGPWMTKHNGKYYLQYAAIGLEFLSYSHGVYVGDSPTGPFTYSEHNPLTFKTTGFAVGAGHGSTFHDKNGQLWTICMIPGNYGGGRGSELAIYPTAVDKDGVMHSETALGDWPQYWPGSRKGPVGDNWTGWKLLSHKKKVEVSSTFENYAPAQGVDEDFMTCWAAETGDPGEYFCVDLGKVADLRAIQVNFDHIGGAAPQGRGFGAPQAPPGHYQCYTVEVSADKVNWTKVADKPDNKQEFRHVYIELPKPVNARYVKVTNLGTYDGAKFCVKDLRVFGNPDVGKSTVVKDVKVVRNPEDRREAARENLLHRQAQARKLRQEQRIENLENQYAAESEENQVPDPDAAVEIHGLLAVIPPAGVKALFHDPACAVFERAAEEERDGKGGTIAVVPAGDQLHRRRDEHGAGAVDRQPRPREKAAVDEAVILPVLERDLNAPAKE